MVNVLPASWLGGAPLTGDGVRDWRPWSAMEAAFPGLGKLTQTEAIRHKLLDAEWTGGEDRSLWIPWGAFVDLKSGNGQAGFQFLLGKNLDQR